MLVKELKELQSLLQTIKMRPDLASMASDRAGTVEAAIWKWGVVNSADYGQVFAYELDGAPAFCLYKVYLATEPVLLPGYGGTVIQDGPQRSSFNLCPLSNIGAQTQMFPLLSRYRISDSWIRQTKYTRTRAKCSSILKAIRITVRRL